MKNELRPKGLKIKNKDKFGFWFRSGVSFDYLGFRFLNSNFENEKLNRAKFMVNKYVDPFNIIRSSKTSVKDRSELLVFISPKSFRRCCDKIRGILIRSNSTLSVDDIIKRYNKSLCDIVNYFEIIWTTRIQLRYLDYLGHRWFRRLLLILAYMEKLPNYITPTINEYTLIKKHKSKRVI